ncbi:hypothetical protein ABZW30_36550 [Kitasatospora sp. NPDC004669]|uniref:hypothetical protein n=1 Tax=Kitasatospora sp. NPDC004669 TaxID=3154555 RepID=UPI0033B94110
MRERHQARARKGGGGEAADGGGDQSAERGEVAAGKRGDQRQPDQRQGLGEVRRPVAARRGDPAGALLGGQCADEPGRQRDGEGRRRGPVAPLGAVVGGPDRRVQPQVRDRGQ